MHGSGVSMGLEHSESNHPEQPGRRNNPAQRHDSDLPLPSDTLIIEERREAFAHAVLRELKAQTQSPVSARLLGEIAESFASSPSADHDKLFAQALGTCIRYKFNLRIAVQGFDEIAQAEIPAATLHADHCLLLGALILRISNKLGAFSYMGLNPLREEALHLLMEGATPKLFQFFCNMTWAIYKQTEAVPVAADAVSHLLYAGELVMDAKLSPERFARLEDLCSYEIKGGRAVELPILIEAYARSVQAAEKIGTSGAKLPEFIEETITMVAGKGQSITRVLPALNTILQSNPSEAVLRSARTALLRHAGSDEVKPETDTVAELLADIFRAEGLPELILTHESAEHQGILRSNSESLTLLRRLAAQSVLHALTLQQTSSDGRKLIKRAAELTGVDPGEIIIDRDASERYMARQANLYFPLRSIYSRELGESRLRRSAESTIESLIPPVQIAFLGWKRLVDLYNGFGALTMDARRNPKGEPAMLARLGNDLGSVLHINAEDIGGFPGRGFAIGKLDPARIFPAASGDPLTPYRRAWPGYAKALNELSGTEFIFTRAFMAVTGVGRIHTLDFDGGQVPYSLLLFNSHHGNPTARVACLVPSRALHALLSGTTASFDSIKGFDPSVPDVNVRAKTAEHFLAQAQKFGPVYDVGAAAAVTRGVLELEHRRWGRYLKRADEHTKNVQAWDDAFLSGNSRAIEAIGGMEREYALQEDALKLETQRASLVDRHHVSVEKPLWDLVHHYLDLVDVFRIVHSRWQRGYTLDRGTQRPSQDEQPQQQELVLDETEDQFLNRSSLRMLREAYALHSQRADPSVGRDRFPILAVVDALQYSRIPELTSYIDTFDMRAVLESQVVQLSPGEMTMEDELFFVQNFLPRAADKDGRVGGLRFIPRHYVGIK